LSELRQAAGAVRAARERQGVSRRWVAHHAKVSWRTLGAFEEGNLHTPPGELAPFLDRVATALGPALDPAWLRQLYAEDYARHRLRGAERRAEAAATRFYPSDQRYRAFWGDDAPLGTVPTYLARAVRIAARG